MRLIILAASLDDGLDWLDRFVGTRDVERAVGAAVGDVHAAKALIIYPDRYDMLEHELDPDDLHWLNDEWRKVVRTNRWAFDQRVLRALQQLHARHRLIDPTGLLGTSPDEIERRRGWMPQGPTSAPLGARSQRNVKRETKTPRKSGLSGAGLQLPR